MSITDTNFLNAVKQAPVGISVFKGLDFVVEMANNTYLEIVDRTETEFVGRSLFDSLPEVKDVVEPLLRKVMTTGEPHYGLEFPVTLNRFGNSELTYFNFVYQPLIEADGTISGVIVVANEVSASVRSKHALAESEREFRNMVMQSPIPMTIFRGRDYVIEMANRVMFENIWRKKESDIIGKKMLEVFPELNNQKYPELLDQVYTTGKAHREVESYALIKGDNGLQEFYLDFEYAPLFETDNSISGILITVNDATSKVKARQKIEQAEESTRQFAAKLEAMVNERTRELAIANEHLQQTNRELERSNADLEKFAYAASHDMKEPIRKIRYFTDLITRKSNITEEGRGFLEKIDLAAGRMSALINDLLAFAQISTIPKTPEKIITNELIKQTITDLELEINESGASIIYNNIPDIEGHTNQVQQAIQNLLSNAIKFRSPDRQPEIQISYLPDDTYHVLEFKDNGIGFDPSQSDHIFEVFTRLHNRSIYSGTGIGLSIVRKVMDNHNGFVKATSSEGNGSLFRLYFPVIAGI